MSNLNRKFAKTVTMIPGPKSLELYEMEQKHISPGIQTIATASKIAVEKGEGAVIEDVDGNRYIDFFAGVGVASLGYNHPKYVKMMQEQVSKIHVGSFTSRHRAELTELLATVAIGDLNRTQFYSGGAEAVEAALRLAKSYNKKSEVLGFWSGFHGKTMGVLGLLGDTFKRTLGPLPFGRYNTPYANCSKCIFNQKFPGCRWQCVDFIKDKIRHETTGDIGAIIVEPIQGTAGNVIPPEGFLLQLRRLADEIGAVLIADEMITGFGRTGKMFGCQHDGVIPDIITIGKGFGGGFPITGLMSRDEIIFSEPFSKPSGSSSSYGGNPLGSASAYITVKTIVEEGLVENSRKVGALMLDKFKKFQDRFNFVGDVRGKGLMIGLELVKDRASMESLPAAYTNELFQYCLSKGLIIMGYHPEIRINPPLVITEQQAEEGISIMEEAFEYLANKFNI